MFHIYKSNKKDAFPKRRLNSRGSRIRTHDLRFWRPLFYQLNYTPI